MQEILNTPPAEKPPIGTSMPPFTVVIVYQDFETGKHARQTYDYLAKNLGEESDLRQMMWKFDVLANPELREMAVRDAADADIVIISSRGGSELPPVVRIWVEQWLTASGQPPLALVALFVGETGHATGVRSYLADVARRGRMKFFPQPESAQVEERTIASELVQTSVRYDMFRSSEAAFQKETTMPRWGINE